MRLEGRWASLLHPTGRTLWAVGAATFVSTHAQVVARGWLARELTGDNSGLGGVLLAFGLTLAVTTPIGGLLADRTSRRTLIQVALALLTASSMGLGWLEIAGHSNYVALLAASAVQAAAFALFTPARTALVSSALPREVLPGAIALSQLAQESSKILGPAVAGLALAAWVEGVAAVYLAGGTVTLLALAATVRLGSDHPERSGVARSVRHELADGVAHVSDSPELATLMLVLLGLVLLAMPVTAVLPGLAEQSFGVGAGGYGLMTAAMAVGAVAATIGLAGRSDRSGSGRLLSGFGLAASAGLLGLASAPSIAPAVVSLVVIGAGSAGAQALTMSLLLDLSEPAFHGRVQSLALLVFSAYGVAALPISGIADTVGARTVTAALGLVLAAGTGCYTLYRRRRYPSGSPSIDLG